MAALKLNSAPVITCDHLFIQHLESYCVYDSSNIKHGNLLLLLEAFVLFNMPTHEAKDKQYKVKQYKGKAIKICTGVQGHIWKC